jgi:nifR3 family TIM-barrel protein
VRIGDVEIPVPVVLAPMAGITDVPFRRLVRSLDGGACLLTAEMVTARGLVEGDPRTWSYVDLPRELGTRSLQLYGSDPTVLGEAVAMLVDEDRVDHVDLNLGCPVPKITSDGGGAALPVKRPLLRAVLRAAVRAASGRVPVTVKIRLGLDDDRRTHLDTAAIAVEEGIAAVALHARTVEQGYAGTARWEQIAELVRFVDHAVPALGNGDVWLAEDAVAMVDRTGCDGVVVGRGCLGRPWLFADLAAALGGRDPAGPPRFSVAADLARRHLDLLLDHAGATDAVVRRFRKHLRWYVLGYVDRDDDRHDRAGRVGSRADVEAVLASIPGDARVEERLLAAPRGKQSRGRVKLPHGWWADRDAHVTVPDPTGVLSGG